MSNSKKQTKKKRKIRYDRVFAVLGPLLLIIILIVVLCLHSCNKNKTDSQTETTPVATATSTEVATEAETVEEAQAGEVAIATSVHKTQEDIARGDLILINADNSYSFPNGDPDTTLVCVHDEANKSYTVGDMEVKLTEDTVEALNAMMADYESETGYSNITVFSGFRSAEDQQSRYDRGTSVFEAGCTDYHSGRTFNMKLNFSSTSSDYYNSEKYPDYSWIKENCANYGFIIRYPEGKDELTGDDSREYTLRYVGIPHAQYITENSLCLEEYIEQMQYHTEEDPLTYETEDTSYEIYYVIPDRYDDTVIDEYTGSEYTISGTNDNGFIVTKATAK